MASILKHEPGAFGFYPESRIGPLLTSYGQHEHKLAKIGMDIQPMAFVFRRHSPIRLPMDTALTRLMEGGAIEV